MAIYHFSVQILGRGQNRRNQDGSARKRPDNVIAAAAYRAGERLIDEGRGQQHDYSNRQGVAHQEIMLPEGVAPWLADRSRLWNDVERMESRKDAQLAREINIALPYELDHAARVALVRSFVAEQFVSKGMVADVALHNPVVEKGDDPRNVHAHVMLTLRRGTPNGLDSVKTREWNARVNVGQWRARWQEHANRALAECGRSERIDHRTLAAQKEDALSRGDRKQAALLDRTPEIHVGPRPKAMQRRGVAPQSRVREVGPSRRQRPTSHLQGRDSAYWEGAARHAMREQDRATAYRKLKKEQGKRQDAGEAEGRLARARARWDRKRRREERTRTWAMRQEARESQYLAWRDVRDKQRARKQGERRTRDYPRLDQGPRIGRLWEILAGNNAKAKADLARIDRASATFTRWLDHWDRKASWYMEGQIKGAAFRRDRWLAGQQAKAAREEAVRKAEHARKRAAQMKALTQELRQIAALLGWRQETGHKRERQVEGWLRGPAIERPLGRSGNRSRPGYNR